jgi:hypothetical protein
MKSKRRIWMVGITGAAAAIALVGCSLLGIKPTVKVASVTANYDTTGGTGLKNVLVTLENDGPGDASNLAYELVLNNTTTFNNTAPVLCKATMGCLKEKANQTQTINASDIANYVSGNGISTANGKYYFGAVDGADNSVDPNGATVANVPYFWWIDNQFAYYGVSGSLNAGGTFTHAAGPALSTGTYNVYIGLVNPTTRSSSPSPPMPASRPARSTREPGTTSPTSTTPRGPGSPCRCSTRQERPTT